MIWRLRACAWRGVGETVSGTARDGVSEFGDSQYIEFKPRTSPLRWNRPKPPGGLSVRSRARFYMMHVARFIQSSVSYKPERRVRTGICRARALRPRD